MAKKYVLLKDLPDVSSGVIFEEGKFTDAYYLRSNQTKTQYNCYMYPKDFVENNHEWFSEIKEEEVEKEFVWTDELVRDFYNMHRTSSEIMSKYHFTVDMVRKWKEAYQISQSIPSGKGTANDVLNTETIDDFWKRHNIREMNDRGGYNFVYNDKQCFGQVTTLPYTTQLKIRPCLITEDIGMGAGQAVYKDFPRTDVLNTEGELKFKKPSEKSYDGERLNRYTMDEMSQFQTPKENYYNDLRDADKWRKKERIEVMVKPFENYAEGKFLGYYVVEPTKPIPPEKLSIIKQAIEDIINNEYDEYVFQPKTNYNYE